MPGTRYEPGRAVDLRVAIVIDRLLDEELSVRIRLHTHDRKPLACRAREKAQVGIEDIECEDSTGSQMATNGVEQRRKIIRLAQMKNGVPGCEDQREPAAKIEVSHVSLDEVDVRATGNCTPPRSHQHLPRRIQSCGWRTHRCNGHDELTASTS